MFDIQKAINDFSFPVAVGSFFSIFYGSTGALAAMFAFFIVADLLAAWNLVSVNALRAKGIINGGFFHGLWLAWKDGTFSSEPMLNKFIPKCGKYFKAFIFLAVFMWISRELNFTEAYYISNTIIGTFMGVELKSIARNLREAQSPLYEYIGCAIDSYYDKKTTQSLPVPPDKEVKQQ